MKEELVSSPVKLHELIETLRPAKRDGGRVRSFWKILNKKL